MLIRRFDERAGWLAWGFQSCAEWLHYRCDISLSAAREKVRVAHALKTLPSIGRAFAEGKLSYSKLRALTRVADRDNEDELLAFALRTTAAQVEERCRELRNGRPESTEEALEAYARRALSLRHDPHRGTVVITVELPAEAGELVDKALDRALEAAVPSKPGPEEAGESWSARRADALVALVAGSMRWKSISAVTLPRRCRLTLPRRCSSTLPRRCRTALQRKRGGVLRRKRSVAFRGKRRGSLLCDSMGQLRPRCVIEIGANGRFMRAQR
ncbi:MAG: 13E12 repeat family protein [Gammaproteobacteria bacterium]